MQQPSVAIFVGLVALAAIGCGDEGPPDFATFTDPLGSFSIQYPSDWELQVSGHEVQIGDIRSKQAFLASEVDSWPNVDVTVTESPVEQALSMETFIQGRGFLLDEFQLLEQSRTNVGDYEALMLVFEAEYLLAVGRLQVVELKTAVSGVTWTVRCREDAPAPPKTTELCKSIVSSLRVLTKAPFPTATPTPAPAQASTPTPFGGITTIAGTGVSGFSGDGGPATAAQLNNPQGIAVDGAGNLYIADFQNNRIRKVDTDGTITTVAGTGGRGFSGDGGPATNAELDAPTDVAVDGAGNLYIADTLNHRIRKVDTDGTITTVAGTGTRGFSGDDGPAVSAQLALAHSVAVDGAGNLYVAEGSRIRKVDTGGFITTVAGTGARGFSGDGGPAVNAELDAATGVAVDSMGNLYVADRIINRIRKVDTSGTITTVAGTGTPGFPPDFSGDGGPSTGAQLAFPAGVAVDGAGNLYIADTFNNRIRKVDTSGTITTVVGIGTPGFSGDGAPAASAELAAPQGVAVDGVGNLYIADAGNHRIRKVTSLP